MRRRAPALLDGRTTREPLQAVTVQGADPGEGIPAAVVRHRHVAQFGMQESVHRLAVRDDSSADPGSDGHVQHVGAAARRVAETGVESDAGVVQAEERGHVVLVDAVA